MPHVYVMSAPHAVKIGVTHSDPDKRRRQIEGGAGQPIELVAVFELDDTIVRWVERDAHDDLDEHRTIGEWFTCSSDTAVAAVARAVQKRSHPIADLAPPWPEPHTRPNNETSAAISALEAKGVKLEIAVIHVLGGTATSRQIASALAGDPPASSLTLSIGRRCYGHQNRGYLTRWGNEWHLTDRAREQIPQETAT
jgi:hypothetical protein